VAAGGCREAPGNPGGNGGYWRLLVGTGRAPVWDWAGSRGAPGARGA